MTILTIRVALPKKYDGLDDAIRYNLVDCIASALSVPFHLGFSYEGVSDPVIKLEGNLRRIGPVTNGKINLAVKQGLAITRNQCGLNTK
jgi:hypothetical protein